MGNRADTLAVCVGTMRTRHAGHARRAWADRYRYRYRCLRVLHAPLGLADIGWSDFGYLSTDLVQATPNIDTLAAQGVKIK